MIYGEAAEEAKEEMVVGYFNKLHNKWVDSEQMQSISILPSEHELCTQT